MTAIALYDFMPTDSRHLGLTVGEVILDVHHLGNGWATGLKQSTGESGAFPANYVESNITELIIKEEKKKALLQNAEIVETSVDLTHQTIESGSKIQQTEYNNVLKKPEIRKKPKLEISDPIRIQTDKELVREENTIPNEKPEIRRKPKLEISDPIPIQTDKEIVREENAFPIEKPAVRKKPKLEISNPVPIQTGKENATEENAFPIEKPAINIKPKLKISDPIPIKPDKGVSDGESFISTLPIVTPVPTAPYISKKPKPVISNPTIISDTRTKPGVDVQIPMTYDRHEDVDNKPIVHIDTTKFISRPRGPPPPLPKVDPPSIQHRHPPTHPKISSTPNVHSHPLPVLDPPLIQKPHRPLVPDLSSTQSHRPPPLPKLDQPKIGKESRQEHVDRNVSLETVQISDIQKPQELPKLPNLYPTKIAAPEDQEIISSASVENPRSNKRPPALPKIDLLQKRKPTNDSGGDVDHQRTVIQHPNILPKLDIPLFKPPPSETENQSGFAHSKPKLEMPLIDSLAKIEVVDETVRTHKNTVQDSARDSILKIQEPIISTLNVSTDDNSRILDMPQRNESNLNLLQRDEVSLTITPSVGHVDTEKQTSKPAKNKKVASKPKKVVVKKPKGRARPARKKRRKHFGYKDIVGQKHAFSLQKMCYGFLGGLLSGTVFFLMLIYCYSYDYAVAGWMTLGWTLLSCIFMALFMYCRLLIVLMVPALFTGQGRTAFLSVIFGILLAGPFLNIFHNGKEAAGSIACTAELIKNQTKALAKELAEPIIKIAEKLNNTFHDLLDKADEIIEKFRPIQEAIKDFEKALKAASDFVASLSVNCTALVTEANSKCKSGVNAAKKACEDEVNKIDPTTYVADTAEDTYNKGKDTINNVFGRRRRDEYGIIKNDLGKLYKRYKRGLDSVCAPLDVSSACNVLNYANSICDPLSQFQEEAEKLLNKTLEELKLLTEFFVFGIDTDLGLTGDVNISKTASSIVSDVTNELNIHVNWITGIAKIFSNILILTVLILFIKSILYVKNFNSKDSFDNVYITKAFKKFDAACKKLGKKTVLPLKRRETRKYTDTTSIILSQSELKHCQEGSSIIGLHLIVTACIIFGDYVLYYILVLVITYGEIDIQVSNVNIIQVTVVGNNPIAKFLRDFLGALQFDAEFDVYFNMTQCLPTPSEPKTSNIFLFFFLYFVAGIFVYMQAFGMRIRPKVTALYYPEREFERIHWLHEKIRHKRMTLFGWLFQHLKSRKKENDVSERVTLSSWFYYRCPTFASLFGGCKPKRTYCLSCGVSDVGLTKFRVCQTSGCDAVYCMDCFKEMKKRCYRCKKKKWDKED